MRTAITLAKVGGKWTIHNGPEVDLQKQKDDFKKIVASGGDGKVQNIQIWESGAGRTKEHSFERIEARKAAEAVDAKAAAERQAKVEADAKAAAEAKTKEAAAKVKTVPSVKAPEVPNTVVAKTPQPAATPKGNARAPKPESKK